MDIVSDELKARTLGVEDLAAARDKNAAGRTQVAALRRKCRCRLSSGSVSANFQGAPSCLGDEEGQTNTPHDACSMRVSKGLVLTHELYRESTGSCGGFQVIVQIEILR